EWYPQALMAHGGEIDWGKFMVEPRADGPLPGDGKGSHYYAARETDAAMVRVCGDRATEREKFLFYRGVGTFPLPLKITLEQDGARLRVAGPAAGRLVVFERHGEDVRWTVVGKGEDDVTVTRAALAAAPVGELYEALRTVLRDQGLFPKE